MRFLLPLCLCCVTLTAGRMTAAESNPAEATPSRPAPTEAPLITEETARRAIARFRADPTSEAGRGVAAVIMRFADKSPMVNVVISPKATPWIAEKIEKKYASLLLAAFVAGNVQSQMDRNTRKDDPVAGVRQTLETYKQIREKAPDFRVASLDKLAELQAAGRLAEYLAEK